VSPDPALVLDTDPRRLNVLAAARYILRIRTNAVLITASACGYYFLAGVEIFGTEFTRAQYRINQAVANLVLLGAPPRRGGRRAGRRRRRGMPCCAGGV
jgi:hypothetical protein